MCKLVSGYNEDGEYVGDTCDCQCDSCEYGDTEPTDKDERSYLKLIEQLESRVGELESAVAFLLSQ